MGNTLLFMSGVAVAFDGFRALDGVDFYLDPGELRVVIGPNGAGKTTLLDVICGRVRPAAGQVVFRNTDLVGRAEHEIAALGIGRKFQTPGVYPELTVAEHLELSARQPKGVFATLHGRRPAGVGRRIAEALELIELADRRDVRAGLLSHGEKQWLELGMLIVQEPELLLLDEPVAGMTDQETEKTARLLSELARRHALLVIEHDMAFVRAIAHRVTVLHEGRVLCEGPVDLVQRDPRVVEVYLGRAREGEGCTGAAPRAARG